MPARKLDELQRVTIESPDDLRRWLSCNHGQVDSVWVVTWKKHTGGRHVPWGAVVDEALCFGWIDSLPRKLDSDRSMILLSPRRAGSSWSAINKAKALRLTAECRMTNSGLAKIDAAMADGGWSRLNDVEALLVPDDLAAELNRSPIAAKHFASFSRSSRRGILEWIRQAKRAETRARRITDTVQLAARGLRANHAQDLKAQRHREK